jgi:hypothetical protein
MVANPKMMEAYRAGVPGNGKRFPDGSKIAKIEWKPKKSTEAPFEVRVPDTLQDVFLIEKDSTRFPATSGWAYAVLTTTRDPTGTRPIRPAPSTAATHVIRGCRQRITSLRRTEEVNGLRSPRPNGRARSVMTVSPVLAEPGNRVTCCSQSRIRRFARSR